MNVLVRGLLVCGAAAATALLLRDPLARRVADAVAPNVRAAAAAVEELSPGRAAEPPRTAPVPAFAAFGAPVTAPPPSSTSPTADGRAQVGPAAKHVAASPKAKPTSTNGAHAVTRAELEAAMNGGLSGARVELVRDGEGRALGLALHGVAALARFGVSEGDVLSSANGMPLRTPEEALAALGKLEHASRVTVTLRRGASAYSVALELQP